MNAFENIRRLDVWRIFSNGHRQLAGTLAQNRQGVFFQYHDDFLARYANLSPFALRFTDELQMGRPAPNAGLHGVFADSLPDGWGLLLMDRVFRQHGVLSNQLTPLDRLAFIGTRAIGALEYEPASEYQPQAASDIVDIADLGVQAQALFDGDATEVLEQLARVGSSGGARPKAQLYFHEEGSRQCSTAPKPGYTPWLVKFTSQHLPLGHEEGLCEAAYLTLAKQAGIDVPAWQLIEAPEVSGAKAWLALKRFDYTADSGRLHQHTLAGLLDADFRLPSLDYEDVIKASSMLCNSPAAGQVQFRRAVFNLFALNQDDHGKNWAFLQGDDGRWSVAPFYDPTFSPGLYGEHITAYAGFGKSPPLKAMQKLAAHANFAGWRQARTIIEEVADTMSQWDKVAKELGVSTNTRQLIGQQLSRAERENRQIRLG